MLLREMDHRVKNLLTLASGIVSLSARWADTPGGLASDVRDRLSALARAHALTLSKTSDDVSRTGQATTLHAMIRTIVSRFVGETDDGQARVVIRGPDIAIDGAPVTSLALLVHEFATNAAKYGALSTSDGRIDIECSENSEKFLLSWKEEGGPEIQNEPDVEGFGSLLARMTVERQLSGELSRDWRACGLAINLSVARNRLAP